MRNIKKSSGFALFYVLIIVGVLSSIVIASLLRQRHFAMADASVYDHALRYAQRALQICIKDLQNGPTLAVIISPPRQSAPGAWKTQWLSASELHIDTGVRTQCLVEEWPFPSAHVNQVYQVTAQADTGAARAGVQTQLVVSNTASGKVIRHQVWRELLLR